MHARTIYAGERNCVADRHKLGDPLKKKREAITKTVTPFFMTIGAAGKILLPQTLNSNLHLGQHSIFNAPRKLGPDGPSYDLNPMTTIAVIPTC